MRFRDRPKICFRSHGVDNWDIELVPDPDFNDASKWDLSGSGCLPVIADGLLTFTSCAGSADAIGMEPLVELQTYYYEIDVRESGNFATIGVPGYTWVTAYGTGIFTGSFSATGTSGVRIAQESAANFVVAKVSIYIERKP